MIRIGDYKMMHHLNSGEKRLYNVAEDYVEKNDLAAKMPEKVMEMDRIRRDYVDEVDGGRMEDIYAAVLKSLDGYLSQDEKNYLRSIEKLRQEKPDSFIAQKARLDDSREQKKRQHLVKTEILKDQMRNPSWRGSRKDAVMKRLGVSDKKGTRISK